MIIRKITDNKKEYLDLLLLADEQEDMIDRYLEQGDMFVLYDTADGAEKPVAECVVVTFPDGTAEIKNIAVAPDQQKKGYGAALIRYVLGRYAAACHTMFVGTGDSPLTVPFYQRCGFTEHHRVRDFFTDNYDHPIWEAGVLLKDMVYLAQDL